MGFFKHGYSNEFNCSTASPSRTTYTFLKTSLLISPLSPLGVSPLTVNDDYGYSYDRLEEMKMQSFESMFNYIYHDVWEIGADPRTKNFPLISGGPWTIFAIIIAYLWFVKVKGPALMKSRPAYGLKPLIFIYNVIMMITNTYFFVCAASQTRLG